MYNEIIDKLYNEYLVHGYITENEIFQQAEQNNLSILEIDSLCDTLINKGVIVKNEEIEEKADTNVDRSSFDYDKLFSEVCVLEPDLKDFIEYIKQIKPPQNREWKNLLPQAQQGNAYAKNRVFEMYMRVVVKIALAYSKKYNFPLQDTIQDGMIGLYTAIDKFEFGRQDVFPTYFPFWVMQTILREAPVGNYIAYYPANFKSKLFKINDICQQHSCELCMDYDICPKLINQIMDELVCDHDTALKYYYYSLPYISLDELLTVEEDEFAVDQKDLLENEHEKELLFSDNGEFWEKALYDQDVLEIYDIVNKKLSKLKENQQMVIKERYGIVDGNPKTLEQVGEMFNLTRERIRQIEAKTLKKLQNSIHINDIT